MAQKVREIMSPQPVTLTADRPVTEAAAAMKQHGIGNVIVLQDDGAMCGLVTDRDLAVRVLADGRDPKSTKLGDVCSRDIVTLGPEDDVDEAITLVRERAVRRIPVVDAGKPVGVITLGDLALRRDERSALADVSGAPANV